MLPNPTCVTADRWC